MKRVSKLLRDNYIFPEVAEEMAEFINSGLNSTYLSMDWPQEFSECLTKDLRAISNDRHLGVIYDPKAMKSGGTTINSEDCAAAAKTRIKT